MSIQLTLGWLRSAQKPSGGFSAWHTSAGWGPEYPEVTGYLIPTLLKYGEIDMACRAADWLCSVQFENGMFPNLDGRPTVFDSGAATEGLKAIHNLTLERRYKRAMVLAKSQLRPRLLNYKYKDEPPVLARGQGILGMSPEAAMDWGEKHWIRPVRSHYLAYWIEGLYRMGIPPVEIQSKFLSATMAEDGGLVCYEYTRGWEPSQVRGGDICATLQFSWLFSLFEGAKNGKSQSLLDGASRYVRSDGGVPLRPNHQNNAYAWCAKYYLDAMWSMR